MNRTVLIPHDALPGMVTKINDTDYVGITSYPGMYCLVYHKDMETIRCSTNLASLIFQANQMTRAECMRLDQEERK